MSFAEQAQAIAEDLSDKAVAWADEDDELARHFGDASDSMWAAVRRIEERQEAEREQ